MQADSADPGDLGPAGSAPRPTPHPRAPKITRSQAHHPDLAQVTIERQGARARVVVDGELDMSNAESTCQKLLSAAMEGSTDLLLDLSKLLFLDSAGIAALFRLDRSLAEQGIRFQVLTGAGTVAARTLALAGMDQILPMATVEEPPAG